MTADRNDATRNPAATRRLPIGAELLTDGQMHFRVWAPKCRRCERVLANSAKINDAIKFELESEPDGYFSLTVPEAKPGMRYGFRLDGDHRVLPDPASRFQPDGPAGLSQIVDSYRFSWSDQSWPGVNVAGQVIYELHVGTFTQEGAWAAAERELAELARIGVTVLEIMPVAEFHGQFGWGYDGVLPFAPTHLYGGPDEFRRFVDRAHAIGLGVILDVVYNHFGICDNTISTHLDGCQSGRLGGHAAPWQSGGDQRAVV